MLKSFQIILSTTLDKRFIAGIHNTRVWFGSWFGFTYLFSILCSYICLSLNLCYFVYVDVITIVIDVSPIDNIYVKGRLTSKRTLRITDTRLEIVDVLESKENMQSAPSNEDLQ